jgi:sucrose-6-phosphate hydrolase SacC (GH32 family)
MTLPREVTLVKTAPAEWKLKSTVVKEFSAYRKNKISISKDKMTGNKCLLLNQSPAICEALITFDRSKCKEPFQILITSTSSDTLIIGYDPSGNNYFIDRRKAGISEFNPLFAAKHTTPCLSKGNLLNLHLMVDKTSVELFTDEGLTVMTDIFFPKSEMNKIEILSNNLSELLKENTVYTLHSKK